VWESKPGLSHNPVNNSCVALCPGRYGETFQIVNGFGIPGYNRYHIYFDVKIDECMHECLNGDGSQYVCKYVDVHSHTSKVCQFNEIPDDEAPQPTPHVNDYTFLQRDCAASILIESYCVFHTSLSNVLFFARTFLLLLISS